MPTHKVSPGECLSLIASKYGFANWRLIYDRPENAAFRKLRPDPNVIQPGDEIFIPDVRQKTARVNTGEFARVTLKGNRAWLVLQVREYDGSSVPDCEFEVSTVRSEKLSRGRTGSDGTIRCELASDVTEAILRLPDRELEWVLEIGGLDPLTGDDAQILDAARQRLTNLGYDCGGSGSSDPQLNAAILAFQSNVVRQAMPSGLIDEGTKAALLKEHGR